MLFAPPGEGGGLGSAGRKKETPPHGGVSAEILQAPCAR